MALMASMASSTSHAWWVCSLSSSVLPESLSLPNGRAVAARLAASVMPAAAAKQAAAGGLAAVTSGWRGRRRSVRPAAAAAAARATQRWRRDRRRRRGCHLHRASRGPFADLIQELLVPRGRRAFGLRKLSVRSSGHLLRRARGAVWVDAARGMAGSMNTRETRWYYVLYVL